MEVVGDLRVTDANELRRGYPFAVLKAVIVSPPMLVGFAGNVPLAMHTLRTLPAQPTNVDVVLPVLEEASRVGGSSKWCRLCRRRRRPRTLAGHLSSNRIEANAHVDWGRLRI